jgi:hypothetical protein
MFSRATIFIAVLSGVVIALALVAQANGFGRLTLTIAVLLTAVALFIGIATFVRTVEINYEDARSLAGMNRLREAYVAIVPEVREFLANSRDQLSLAHGARQGVRTVGRSLTTTSGLIATLNSALVGAFASGLLALGRAPLVGATGVGVSIASGVLHARYAARFRQRHAATATR